jgi:uncharacterized protein YdeI (YjbR/CyaY-like superfamily)
MKAFNELRKKPQLAYENRNDGAPLVPEDLLSALKMNKKASDNFIGFTQSHRRMYIEWLNSAKKTETRIRRIEKIIGLAEKNIKPGMGVI